MKNEHLVPIVILQLIERLAENNLSENERAVIITRLEAIRDATNLAIEKNNKLKVKS